MNLEQQVTSLELSRKLKELGVRQESLYSWSWSDYRIGGKEGSNDNGFAYVGGKFKEEPKSARLSLTQDWYAEDEGCLHDHDIEKRHYAFAYTVSELKELLPFGMVSYRKGTGGYTCSSSNAKYMGQRKAGDTEADACAKMLIKLLESNNYTCPGCKD